jgi:hypothetical protein
MPLLFSFFIFWNIVVKSLQLPCSKPLDLKKRNKTLDTVIDGIECFEGNAIGCVKTVDDVVNDLSILILD